MDKKINFFIKNTDNMARCGVIHTKRGTIRTPAFMPVGTSATVKAMLPNNVRQTGADIVLGNTYHLMLRPGAERIDNLGGLHKFMNWSRPILTDSGGFQVMSLAKLCQLSERGVIFRSHIDGSKHELTPEKSIQIQHLLASDIIMCFDECTKYPVSYAQAQASMEMSMRWAKRSRTVFDYSRGSGLFGIQQGSIFPDLRRESVQSLQDICFDGYAIGGLAVGEGQSKMFTVLDNTMEYFPIDKPRYLMGVGKPDDIVGAVQRGVDMFDCVFPSRSGRNGQALTRFGAINFRNARYKDDPRPLDSQCTCPCCLHYSRAYLHHVVRCKEMIASMLLTWHNLHYYQCLMTELRAAISQHRLSCFVRDFHQQRVKNNDSYI